LEIERVGRRLVELDPRHHHEDVAVVLFQLDAGARRERVLDGEGVKLEYLLQEGMLVQVGTVDVHPQLALTRAHDLAQPGGRETSLDPPVGPPIDAGRPVFGRLWCGSRGHDCRDRKSTRLNSSHVSMSYAVFCLKIKRVTRFSDGSPPA